MNHEGIFLISLDFELYWGVRSGCSTIEYAKNLDGVPNAVVSILNIFKEYGIHGTWATVGFLFLRDLAELEKFIPDRLPRYVGAGLCPYTYLRSAHAIVPEYHFAPRLIELIKGYDGQEIGTHTFSHYYCFEQGQDHESFRSDLLAAVRIARNRGIDIKSLVFPGNQCNYKYLNILSDLNIKCFRGSEFSFIYAPSGHKNKLLKACRLLDCYFNISGHHTYDLTEISKHIPYNIPASRFLRPYSLRLKMFDKLRFRRIQVSMRNAARKGKLFHLWWHPHNFGSNTDENIAFLRKILLEFCSLRQQYGMRTLNMGEVANLLDFIR